MMERCQKQIPIGPRRLIRCRRYGEVCKECGNEVRCSSCCDHRKSVPFSLLTDLVVTVEHARESKLAALDRDHAPLPVRVATSTAYTDLSQALRGKRFP